MFLSKSEKETIIVYTEDDSTASVYTCNKALMKKLARLAIKSTSCVMEKEDKWSR